MVEEVLPHGRALNSAVVATLVAAERAGWMLSFDQAADLAALGTLWEKQASLATVKTALERLGVHATAHRVKSEAQIPRLIATSETLVAHVGDGFATMAKKGGDAWSYEDGRLAAVDEEHLTELGPRLSGYVLAVHGMQSGAEATGSPDLLPNTQLFDGGQTRYESTVRVRIPRGWLLRSLQLGEGVRVLDSTLEQLAEPGTEERLSLAYDLEWTPGDQMKSWVLFVLAKDGREVSVTHILRCTE